MKPYILALDQGTTSSRAILFDRRQQVVGCAQKEFTQIYPQAGWVEHDAEEIYGSQWEVLGRVLREAGISAAEVAAIGITNQRETTIVWDKATGRPIHNAIVWQCRRTAPQCEKMKEDGCEGYVRDNTGLLIDAYFSATKVKWLLDNIPGARDRAKRGELLFGTVDTWLIWRLTGGKVHATDYTNASRTMLFNIRTLDWDDNILYELDIPRCMLPKVYPSSHIYGTTVVEGTEIPIAAAAGDQQAALFGQACFDKGDVKNTYGTGCFLLMHLGQEFCLSRNGLITTLAAVTDGRPGYVMEGSVFVGGAVVQWLRDELGLIEKAADSEFFAAQVPDSGGGRPRLYGSRRTLLGHVRPGQSVRADPWSRTQPYHPGCPGIHRLPVPGFDGRPAGRHRARYHRPQSGRRRGGEQLPHAVPGRYAGLSGPTSPGN